jgi:hypothetical protein
LKKRTLSVAEFKILLQSEKDLDIGLEPSYLPFEISNEPDDADVSITSVRGIPKSLRTSTEPLFEAKDDIQTYFSVYEEADLLKIIVYNPLIKNEILKIAFLKKDHSEWVIYSDVSKEYEEIFPMLYPMGPLVFYYLTVKYNAIITHASAVFDGLRGRVFSGFSGSGKSTMACLWQNCGSTIINDDRIMIRKKDKGFIVYNTPMSYVDIPKKMPIHQFYIIEHSEKNQLECLKGARAVSSVMAFCIQHGYNQSILEHHLNFLSDLCMSIPIYKLGFVNNEKVIDFITSDGV